MTNQNKPKTKVARSPDEQSPKFGRLLLVLVSSVAFCGVLTWLMATFFPDFPNF
jgi:hypothetical protein